MTKYQVLISDVRVFKRVIEAEDKAAADEAAQALLDNGYSEAYGGELHEARDAQVDDVYADEPAYLQVDNPQQPFTRNPQPVEDEPIEEES